MSDDGRPEFFKVYIPVFSEEQMEIPKLFKDYMGVIKAGPAKLIGPSAETWQVRFEHNEDGLFFTDGWKDFVKDNELDSGDFLVFRYDNEMVFKVTIYDHTSCEKEAAFRAKCSQSLGENGEQDEKQIENEECKSISGLSFYTKIFPSNIRWKGPYMVRYNSEFAHALICIINYKRIFTLSCFDFQNIPGTFAVPAKLRKGSHVKLRDPSGELYPVTIGTGKHRNKAAVHITNGWRHFFTSNKLKVGDACEFKSLYGSGTSSDPLVIDVKIITS
ncbi:unnamed protein product [Rhodiola kirilowii]